MVSDWMARSLSTMRFCMREEAEELLERKQTKETLGYVPRPRSAPEKTKHTWTVPKRLTSRYEEELDLDEMS